MRIEKKVWIIMSKDRKWIAKGKPRDRWLINMNNRKDTKPILYYATEKKAISAFSNGNGFYDQDRLDGYVDGHFASGKDKFTYDELMNNDEQFIPDNLEDLLEAVPVKLIIEEIK